MPWLFLDLGVPMSINHPPLRVWPRFVVCPGDQPAQVPSKFLVPLPTPPMACPQLTGTIGVGMGCKLPGGGPESKLGKGGGTKEG